MAKPHPCIHVYLIVFRGPVPDPILKSLEVRTGPPDTFSKSLEVQTGPPRVCIFIFDNAFDMFS